MKGTGRRHVTENVPAWKRDHNKMGVSLIIQAQDTGPGLIREDGEVGAFSIGQGDDLLLCSVKHDQAFAVQTGSASV